MVFFVDSSPIGPLLWAAEDAASSVDFGFLARFIVYFLLLIAGGAYFAGAETALSSVNRIRMMTYADDGSKKARRVLYILDHFDEALTTILIGNNIMHIGAATLATLVAARLKWDDFGMSMTSLGTTFIVFFLSEMIPKTIAKACNERFALLVAPSLRVLMKVLYPLNLLFTAIADGAKKLFRVKEEEEPTVSEEELHDIIETLDEEGEIDEDTTELMQSALDFTETPVAKVFTPWEQVTFLRSTMKPKEIVSIIEETNHSRLPVLNKAGHVIGIVQIRKYLKAYLQFKENVQLQRVMDRPYFVKLGTPIDEQLAGMSASKTHIAIVRDENENAVGILTVEDILEELVGEIYDEDDKVDKGGEPNA